MAGLRLSQPRAYRQLRTAGPCALAVATAGLLGYALTAPVDNAGAPQTSVVALTQNANTIFDAAQITAARATALPARPTDSSPL